MIATAPWRFLLSFISLPCSYSEVRTHEKVSISLLQLLPITSPTVEELHTIFACWGLPEKIITDNGPQFTSENFVLSNGIKHSKTAPYHPQSSGAAEKIYTNFQASNEKDEGGHSRY